MVSPERDHQTMSVRSTIISQIEQIAAEQNKHLAPLNDDLALLESGLDSLCLAILVVRLESILGIDPFTSSNDVYSPKTVGELIRYYEQALISAQPNQQASQS
jgi:acyl carrier protein